MQHVGFFYTCFKEKKATEYSIQQLRNHYPKSPIYLVSDGGLDFSYLENEYENLKTSLEEDTMGDTFNITAGSTGCDYIVGNYREDFYQKAIKKCVYSVLDRIERSIKYCNYPDWIVMCDPDCLIRGQLNIPKDGKLFGTRLNCCFPEGYQNILRNIPGAKVITNWGATPCIFEVNTFNKALEKFKELNKSENILDKFSNEFYAMYAHDVLFPTLFALIGEEEVFNPDIIECNRNPNWRNTNHPLVHQFKEYY